MTREQIIRLLKVLSDNYNIKIADPKGKVTAWEMELGNYSAESLGDYMAGPNHVLPTIHTARFFSPLSVYDFVKRTSIIYFDKDAFNKIGKNVASFAHSEGLTAHALAAEVRLES